MYTPNPEVIKHLKKVTLVTVVGPTGAGKTTIINAAVAREPQLKPVINNTSRARRPEETNVADLLFLTRDEMEQRIQRREYVQVAPTVLGDYYATGPEGYAIDGVAVMPMLAAEVPAMRALPFKQLKVIFIVPESSEQWHSQMAARTFTPEQQEKRLAEARQSLNFALTDEKTQFIINGNLTQAVEDFLELALSRPMSSRQKAEQTHGRQLVSELLQQQKEWKNPQH